MSGASWSDYTAVAVNYSPHISDSANISKKRIWSGGAAQPVNYISFYNFVQMKLSQSVTFLNQNSGVNLKMPRPKQNERLAGHLAGL